MRTDILSAGCAVVLPLFAAAPVLAAPVTAAELTGKKICWDNGLISTFLPGGKYFSNMAGNGTWQVTSVGVEIHAEHYSGIYEVDRQPDGSLKSANKHASGVYCK